MTIVLGARITPAVTKPAAADDASIPTLLRRARGVYGAAMASALAGAGFDDLPRSGFQVLGELARWKGSRPLSELIAETGASKQAAGQTVDRLVTSGYLERDVDPEDRRRLTVGLTHRGRAAVSVLAAARAKVDAELLSRAGGRDLERARRVLAILVDIGRERDAMLDRDTKER